MHSHLKHFLMAGLAIAFAAGLALVWPGRASGAPARQASQPVVIYFFWGDGCPHCAKAKPFLADLAARYPSVTVRDYEVWYVADNRTLLKQMAGKFDIDPGAVPTLFIGDRNWIGYNDQIGSEMEAYVKACLASGCPDAGAGVIPGVPAQAATRPPATRVAPAATVTATAPAPASSSPARLDVPLLGTVDLSGQSLLVSTVLIGFVDGFNPCSLWALSILLALTLHTGSRRKVFIIGLVYILVTAGVYALFITGLFTMFTVVNFTGWIQLIVALVAAFFGAVNIKDYFWYKEGISLTIADGQKPGIYRRMRGVMDAGRSTWGMVGATVVLAAGVSLVEFSCTAGFPVLWSNLLVSQQTGALAFIALLLVYMVIYQIDELGIFIVAVVTLKTNRLEEKHGRILKLIGGMLMLTLALVMLVNPALMNNLASSLIIFGLAFAASGLVLVVHRRLLPRLGVRIGSELSPRDK